MYPKVRDIDSGSLLSGEEDDQRKSRDPTFVVSKQIKSPVKLPSASKTIKNDSNSEPKTKSLNSTKNAPDKDGPTKIVNAVSVLRNRKHRMKVEIAKISVKIHEGNDAMEKWIRKQDYAQAQEVKSQLEIHQKEKDRLTKILDNADSDELKEALQELLPGVTDRDMDISSTDLNSKDSVNKENSDQATMQNQTTDAKNKEIKNKKSAMDFTVSNSIQF